MSLQPPTSAAPNKNGRSFTPPWRISTPWNLTHHHKTKRLLEGLAIGWPVHPEIRFEESANGARCFSRLVPDLEEHFQAPKAHLSGRVEASSHAPARSGPGCPSSK